MPEVHSADDDLPGLATEESCDSYNSDGVDCRYHGEDEHHYRGLGGGAFKFGPSDDGVPALKPIDETDMQLHRTLISRESLIDADADVDDDDDIEEMADASTPHSLSEGRGEAAGESMTSCHWGEYCEGLEFEDGPDTSAVLNDPRTPHLASAQSQCLGTGCTRTPGLKSLLRSCLACAGTQQCSQSHCSCQRSSSTSSKRRVSFCEPMVTKMLCRPRTPPEEITDHYYTKDEFREFQLESRYHEEPVDGEGYDMGVFCNAIPSLPTISCANFDCNAFSCYSDALKDMPIMTVFSIDDCSGPWSTPEAA